MDEHLRRLERLAATGDPEDMHAKDTKTSSPPSSDSGANTSNAPVVPGSSDVSPEILRL